MEDTIEICSGCGKMPRALDHLQGQFRCSRCGNISTMHVSAEEYEKVVTDLDQKFHQHTQRKRIEAAAPFPVELKPKPGKKTVKAAKKAPKKSAKLSKGIAKKAKVKRKK
jgi:hypothetical protein